MAVTASEIVAFVRADTRQFQTGMAQAERSTTNLGRTSQRSASQLGAGWALAATAVVGFAAKSVAAFASFQTTMVRTVTLAGSTEAAMNRLSGSVLDLSTKVGKGPQELADALYQIESAGIDTAHAMSVLTASAKGSAIGLGSTETIADSVTSVLNAYGDENITAAHSVDILTAAVRDGKGEADAIAGSIGRVIPIASQMGVGFDQVAAAIAGMTRIGLSADESVTALRGALLGMLAPTDIAKKALDKVGISVDELQSSIAQQGILQTLLDMQDAFHGDTQAMAEVFPNVRALVGVMSLVGQNSAEVQRIFEDVAKSGGTLNDAFNRVRETSAFRLQQAMAAVQKSMIEVGGALAPLVTLLAHFVQVAAPLIPVIVGMVAAWVAWKAALALGGLLDTAIVGLMALNAAAVSTSAAFITAGGGITGFRAALAALQGTTVGAIAGVAAWAVAIGLAIKAGTDLRDYLNQDNAEADNWTKSILSGKASLDAYRQAVIDTTGSVDGAIYPWSAATKVQQALAQTTEQVTRAIHDQNTKIDDTGAVMANWGGYIDDTTNSNLRLHGSIAQLLNKMYQEGVILDRDTEAKLKDMLASGHLKAAIGLLSGALGIGADKANQLAAAHERGAAAAKKQMEAEQQLAGGLLGLIANIKAVNKDQAELQSMREHGKAGTAAYNDLILQTAQDQLMLDQSLQDLKTNLHAAMQGMVDAGTPLSVARQKVMELGKEFGATKKEILDAIGPVKQYSDEINHIPSHATTKYTSDTSQATRALLALHTLILNVTGSAQAAGVQTKLAASGYSYQTHSGGFMTKGGPRRYHQGGVASDEVPAVLQIGEFVMSREATRRLTPALLSVLNRPQGWSGGQVRGGDGASMPGYVDIRHALNQTGQGIKDYSEDIVLGLREKLRAANKAANAKDLTHEQQRNRDQIVNEIEKRIQRQRSFPSRWERNLVQELSKPGMSHREMELIQQYYRAVRRTTTKKEAADARDRLAKTVRKFEYNEYPFTRASSGLSIMVRPDRRRFTRDLDFDSLTRGW